MRACFILFVLTIVSFNVSGQLADTLTRDKRLVKSAKGFLESTESTVKSSLLKFEFETDKDTFTSKFWLEINGKSLDNLISYDNKYGLYCYEPNDSFSIHFCFNNKEFAFGLFSGSLLANSLKLSFGHFDIFDNFRKFKTEGNERYSKMDSHENPYYKLLGKETLYKKRKSPIIYLQMNDEVQSGCIIENTWEMVVTDQYKKALHR